MSLKELKPSEKRLLLFGAVAMIIMGYLLVSSFTGGPGGGQATSLRKMERDRDDLIAAIGQYQAISGNVKDIDTKLKKTPADFDLDGQLIDMIDSLGLRQTVRNVTTHEAGGTDYYSESYVDVDLKEISLDDVVELLKKIETAPAFVRVSQISVKRRYSDDRTLDVNLRVAVYTEKQPETP